MADDASNTPGPFDVRTVQQLARLMSRHDLSEIDLRQGELSIRLRRGPRFKGLSLPATTPAVAPAQPAEAPSAAATPAAAQTPARILHEIKSPTVGTFYAQKEPGAPFFVTVGSRVKPDTVVCLIEAMKTYNEIQAECSGVIVEIVVKNKEPVDFGTVLFRVDTSA